MNKSTLLEFFNKRSNLLKSTGSFSQNSEFRVVAKYKFIVSNYQKDIDNTIEIESLKDLTESVKSYFSDTATNYEEQIELLENLNQTKNMFVHLMLEI